MSGDNNTFSVPEDRDSCFQRQDPLSSEQSMEIVRGYDTLIRYLNGNKDSHPLGTVIDDDVRDDMVEHSPFHNGNDGIVEHSAHATRDEDYRHVDGIETDAPIDDGELYNISFAETVIGGVAGSEGELNPTNVDVGDGTELFTVHTQVYSPADSDEQYLVHWDPGIYTSDGGKDKIPGDDAPKPLNGRTEARDEAFIDNSTYQLDEGLDHVAETLYDMSETLLDEALANYDSQENVETYVDQVRDIDDYVSSILKEDGIFDDKEDYSGLDEMLDDANWENGDGIYDRDEAYSSDAIDLNHGNGNSLETAWEAARWRALGNCIEHVNETYEF
ncbi:MAG: hypothetical protein SV186_05745 [Candidatus Nanohaloarchaea archaeon]|nr:hypothetical protein [Candidatus Nanohaloarchaea archaeon]